MKTQRESRPPHSPEWQLQEAKNRLSQVLDSAMHDGPQTITLRGKPAAVVVSFEEFKKLTRPRSPLSLFFAQSPLHNADLDLSRSTDLSREVDL
jgi:prevent-host-death family protein